MGGNTGEWVQEVWLEEIKMSWGNVKQQCEHTQDVPSVLDLEVCRDETLTV